MAKDYGFRISKDGLDVKTCDDKDCVVTSKYPIFKGSVSGGGTLAPNLISSGYFTGATNDVITTNTPTNHGLQNGDRITVDTYGTLPGGLFINTVYFVVQRTASTFKVSLTAGGSPVDITSTGDGFWNYFMLVTISHGLGFVPLVKGFINPTDSDAGDLQNIYYAMPLFTDGVNEHLYTYIYADGTNVYVYLQQWNPGDAARHYNYKYFIFLEKVQ